MIEKVKSNKKLEFEKFNFKKKWNNSYKKGDNNILYPDDEVIRFLNRFVCKRNNNNTISKIGQFAKNRIIRGLDFACGVGTTCRTLSDFGIDGYGIDLSDTAIDIATQISARAGLRTDRFSVLSSSEQKLPYDENFFDFVIAESCLDSMPYLVARNYIPELKRVSRSLVYASFIGNDSSMSSDEFIVSTEHEKGTVQTVFNVDKITSLFGVPIEKFLYFRSVDKIDCISKKLLGKRYYCVLESDLIKEKR